MDAKPTKPPKTTGSMANIHDRATSTIIGAIEPSPSPTGRPWVGGAVYAPRTARFDDGARALSEDEMRRAAPSIFAARPHASRSERFRAIPTIEVLRGLEKRGLLRRRREAVGIAGRQQDRLHEAHDPAAPSRQCAAIPSRRHGLRDHLAERQ